MGERGREMTILRPLFVVTMLKVGKVYNLKMYCVEITELKSSENRIKMIFS